MGEHDGRVRRGEVGCPFGVDQIVPDVHTIDARPGMTSVDVLRRAEGRVYGLRPRRRVVVAVWTLVPTKSM